MNGPDPNTLDAVLAQLNDPDRQNPQELDKAVIGKGLKTHSIWNLKE